METAARTLLQVANTTASFCVNANTPDNEAGFGFWYQNMTTVDGADIATTQEVCTTAANAAWLVSPGSNAESIAANVTQWINFATCVFALAFYAYHSVKATTGWEEVYVVLIELIKLCLEMGYQYEIPATMYVITGNHFIWSRYAEWLLSCPVILIHLSNITGLQDSYNSRTMMLLISDLGCITMGVTAAACYSWPKWIFFSIGMAYGLNTYYHAIKVYVESYHMVPKGTCQKLVLAMAISFFVSWTIFPILFIFGPEGTGIMSRYGSEIGHNIGDMISKQLWGFMGHYLRVKIFYHVKEHGELGMPSPAKVRVMALDAMGSMDIDGANPDAAKSPDADNPKQHKDKAALAKDSVLNFNSGASSLNQSKSEIKSGWAPVDV